MSVHVELVHDPHRHRAVIGWSADLALIRATAEQLIYEANRRAEQFAGIDDLAAVHEHAEADRLRRVLALVLPSTSRDPEASRGQADPAGGDGRDGPS